jgi:hypothetical protein
MKIAAAYQRNRSDEKTVNVLSLKTKSKTSNIALNAEKA